MTKYCSKSPKWQGITYALAIFVSWEQTVKPKTNSNTPG